MPTPRLLATCLLTGAVFAGGPASAQTPSDAPAADAANLGGAVLRLRAGPSYLGATIGFGEIADRSHSGFGFGFDVAIGGTLSPNVTLGVELFGAVALDASADGSGTISSGGSPTADVSTAGIGPSVSYTFHRFDRGSVYLVANPAFTIARTSDPNHFFLAKDWGSNYYGVGMGFAAGAEWQVSRGWQLGPLVEARYAALSGNGDLSTMSLYALSFAATYD